jgi:hypothetical protein
MLMTLKNSPISTERQIHEEEVRYNEAVRMKAASEIIESIRLKIIELKGGLTTKMINHPIISSEHLNAGN